MGLQVNRGAPKKAVSLPVAVFTQDFSFSVASCPNEEPSPNSGPIPKYGPQFSAPDIALFVSVLVSGMQTLTPARLRKRDNNKQFDFLIDCVALAVGITQFA